MKKIVDSSDSDLNERIRLAQTEDSLTALEDVVKDMSIQLDKIEADEPMNITLNIDGLIVKVEPHWLINKYPINEVVESAIYHHSVDKVEVYLRNKYSPHTGVPYQYVEEETGLTMTQVTKWVRGIGLLDEGVSVMKGMPFIDYSLAAEMAMVEDD